MLDNSVWAQSLKIICKSNYSKEQNKNYGTHFEESVIQTVSILNNSDCLKFYLRINI